MKSSNPIFSREYDKGLSSLQGPMTVNGAINKTFLLGLIVVISAAITVNAIFTGAIPQQSLQAVLIGSGILGFVLALITVFNPMKANLWGSLYAIAEGVFVGGVSLIFEMMYPGIVLQAIGGTFCALFAMLALYKMKLIRATEKFRSTIFIAAAAIALLYLVNFIGNWVSFLHIPMISDSTNMGIAFTGIVCVVAALNLIIDFDNIEEGVNRQLPKETEWYMAFGLIVTLVWLYFEILRLLAKLRSRD